MKQLMMVLILATLPACDAVRTVAPQTVAGFETGGVLGALDGASGAILARCKTLDGTLIRVAVDETAVATGTGDLVGDVRAARQRACARAGQIQAFIDEPFEGDAQEIPLLTATEGGTAQNTDATQPADE